MPWSTPTLRSVRETVRGEITASLGRASFIGNSVLRVMADANAALAHLTMRYVDWVALQLMPDTSEHEWLDRHGDIWLVNSDGSTGRKLGAFAAGKVTVSGIEGTLIPAGTRLLGSDDWPYETTEQVFITPAGVDVAVRSLDYGAGGNREVGDMLTFQESISGVTGQAPVVLIDGGIDSETDDQLRERVLRRIRQPPQGGAAHDYEAWALAVPGVTRAWAAMEMGMGTVTVRFMMDVLRGPPPDGSDNGGFPTFNDVAVVDVYIDTVRPVAVKDIFVVAPIPQPVDVNIADLVPDTTATRAEIKENVEAMLFKLATPGQTIFAAWKSQAIMETAGVVSFRLLNTIDDEMESPGHMAVLGDIFYAES